MRERGRSTGVVLLAILMTLAMVAPAAALQEGEDLDRDLERVPDGVDPTFICKAPHDGVFDLYINEEQGFTQQELEEGDYVFRYFNPNEGEVTFTAGIDGEGYLDETTIEGGEYRFETNQDPIGGLSTLTEGTVTRGTASTNESECAEAGTEYVVGKVWGFLRFDAQQGEAPAPSGEATITVTDADDPDSTLTQDFTVGEFASDLPNSDFGNPSVYLSAEEITQSFRTLSEDPPSVTESYDVPGWTCEPIVEVGAGGADVPAAGTSDESPNGPTNGINIPVEFRAATLIFVGNLCAPAGEVTVDKQWTVDGEPVEADASPEFEVSLTTDFVELPEIEPVTTSGTAVFTDQELFADVTYDVTVEEIEDSIPEDPAELFGLDDDQVCELVETTVEGDDTVTPGTEDHTAEVTVTNAYECVEVLGTTSVEVELEKLWETPDDVDVPSDLAPSFTLELLDADGDVVAEETAPVGTVAFAGLDIGEDYTLVWSEDGDDLDGFTTDDERTCTLSDDSTTAGEIAFVAGDDENLEVVATNIYGCDEVVVLGIQEEADDDEETLPDTGIPALLLSLLGLLGVGLGGTLLRISRRS